MTPSRVAGGSGKSGKDKLAVLAKGWQVTRGGQREIREMNNGQVPDRVNCDFRCWAITLKPESAIHQILSLILP